MKRNTNKLKYNKWMKKNNGENKKAGPRCPKVTVIANLHKRADVPKASDSSGSLWSLCDFEISKESCRLFFCDFVCCMHNMRLSDLDMWQCQVSMSHVWHWTWKQQFLNLERLWPSQHLGIHKLTKLGFLRVCDIGRKRHAGGVDSFRMVFCTACFVCTSFIFFLFSFKSLGTSAVLEHILSADTFLKHLKSPKDAFSVANTALGAESNLWLRRSASLR